MDDDDEERMVMDHRDTCAVCGGPLRFGDWDNICEGCAYPDDEFDN